MDSTQNPAEAERLPLSKSHSTPATSGLRVSENPSPPKPKIVRAPSVLQVAAGRLLSTPTDEQRNADFYRRIRHVQRSGGVNIDRLKKKLSTGPASTPDVEMAETPSGIEMSTRLFRGVQRSLSTDSRKANSTRWPSDAHLRSRPNAIRVVAGDVYKKATGFRLNSIRKYETEISFEASSPQPEDDKTSLDVARSLPITLPGTSARSDLETIEEDELADREAQEDQAARTAASPVKSQSMDPHMSSAERRKNFKEQRKLRGVATEHISTADEPVAEIPLIRPSTLDLRPDAEFKRAVHLEDLFKRSTPSDPVIIIDKGGDLDEALTERSSPEVVVPDINVTYFGDGGELFFDESKVSEEQLLSDIEEALDEDEDKENVGFREPDDMQLTLRRRFPVDISGGAVPTIQVCDEHGAIESDRRGAEESVDFVFSRRTDATVRRKISMKRQDGVDEERKQDRQPFKGFFQRRLTQRLVKKESEDLREAEEAPIPYVQPFAPSVTMRTQRVAFHKEEEIRIEQEPSTRQRIPMGGFQGVKIRGAKFHGPEPPSVEPPAIRKQSRSSIFRRKMKTMKQAVTSAVKSLLGVKDLDQALVVNSKRRRRYTRQGVLYEEEDEEDTTSIGEAAPFEQKMEDLDYRPLFTWWVTSVQLIIGVLALIIYGFGPVALSRVEETKYVYHVSGSYRLITVFDHPNLWFGPAFADLVHAGAKYAPCMRRDKKIFAQIAQERASERQTGCCVMNDRSGCFQTSPDSGECATGFAVMHHWNSSGKGFNDRRSGPVCGLDPRVCRDPPYQQILWPDDITQWPICRRNSSTEGIRHMNCEVTGRPCCIQMQGQCRITTREYCEFVNGYYHEEALLCSQVNCLQEVCGMIPFLDKDSPNQLYRFFTPIFIHAGIVGLAATLFIQLIFMTSVEKMIGWKKTAVIYLCSGLGGYLASAVFVPYMPEVGPAGSQGGLLGTLIVDGYYNWDFTQNKWKQVKNLIVATSLFLAVGFLPWVDNYAQWFGFLYGILFSIVLLSPFEFPNEPDRRFPSLGRIAGVSFAIAALILLTGFLLAMFFWEMFEIPAFFQYFNCLPLIEYAIEHTCDNKGVELKNWLPI